MKALYASYVEYCRAKNVASPYRVDAFFKELIRLLGEQVKDIRPYASGGDKRQRFIKGLRLKNDDGGVAPAAFDAPAKDWVQVTI